MKELIERLRNTPNWQRETFGAWKTATAIYDRAPFEAADALERLTAGYMRGVLAERERCAGICEHLKWTRQDFIDAIRKGT